VCVCACVLFIAPAVVEVVEVGGRENAPPTYRAAHLNFGMKELVAVHSRMKIMAHPMCIAVSA